MKFIHKQFAELPFVLNIPADTYIVRVDNTIDLPVRVHHNLYAGAPGAIEYPAPVAIGEKQALIAALSHNATYSMLQLHTVVSIEKETILSPADLHAPTQDELVDEYTRKLIMQRPVSGADSSTGDVLRGEARDQLAALGTEESERFRRGAMMRLTARKLYPHSEGDQFLRAINRLLRAYMADIEDFFAEEVTLHQVGGTTPRGVLRITECDGIVVDSVNLIGKIPPAMRQPWFVHSSDRVVEMKAHLAAGGEPDAVTLLSTRSKGLLERGAYRSAIIEAGAALETAVARRIVRDMVASGTPETDALKYLHENQRFSDRCKIILKSTSGKSIPELDNTLWARVVQHRDDYRHKIAHSDREPSRQDAENVVGDFLRLAKLVMTFTP